MKKNDNKKLTPQKIILFMLFLSSLASLTVLITERITKGEVLKVNFQNSFFVFAFLLSYTGFWCGLAAAEKETDEFSNDIEKSVVVNYGTINNNEMEEKKEISLCHYIVKFLCCGRCKDQTNDRRKL